MLPKFEEHLNDLKANDKFEFIKESTVEEISGTEKVDKVILKSSLFLRSCSVRIL